jgi:hypothetical protein
MTHATPDPASFGAPTHKLNDDLSVMSACPLLHRAVTRNAADEMRKWAIVYWVNSRLAEYNGREDITNRIDTLCLAFINQLMLLHTVVSASIRIDDAVVGNLDSACRDVGNSTNMGWSQTLINMPSDLALRAA